MYDILKSSAVVIPSYRAKSTILRVVKSCLDAGFAYVIVVDDCCPDGTGELVRENFGENLKVRILINSENLGVGGATKAGLVFALENTDCEYLIKLDADGQMDPFESHRLVEALTKGTDFAKGTRFFSPRHLRGMPPIRIIGNGLLSLVTKISTGYWSVSDPTNGYIAGSRRTWELLELDRISNDYFFESDLLFRLRLQRAKVRELPIPAIYGDEISSLKIRKVVLSFPGRHLVRLAKRIIYLYYVREWNLGSLQLPASLFAGSFAAWFGVSAWIESSTSGIPATTGTVILSTLPAIVSFQLFLSFWQHDISSEP